MKKTNNKMKNVSQNVGGRIFGMTHKAKNKTQRFCAKMVSESPNYITIWDVNNEEVRKLSKKSVTGLSCGEFSFGK